MSSGPGRPRRLRRFSWYRGNESPALWLLQAPAGPFGCPRLRLRASFLRRCSDRCRVCGISLLLGLRAAAGGSTLGTRQLVDGAELRGGIPGQGDGGNWPQRLRSGWKGWQRGFTIPATLGTAQGTISHSAPFQHHPFFLKKGEDGPNRLSPPWPFSLRLLAFSRRPYLLPFLSLSLPSWPGRARFRSSLSREQGQASPVGQFP